MACGHTVCSIQDGRNLRAKRAGHRKQKSVSEEILNFLDVGVTVKLTASLDQCSQEVEAHNSCSGFLQSVENFACRLTNTFK